MYNLCTIHGRIHSQIKKLALILFLVLLLIVAFLLRTRGIVTDNFLLLYDSSRDLLFVKKIVIDHDLLLIGPSSGGCKDTFTASCGTTCWQCPFSLAAAIRQASPGLRLSYQPFLWLRRF